jgi:hypothetical protein
MPGWTLRLSAPFRPIFGRRLLPWHGPLATERNGDPLERPREKPATETRRCRREHDPARPGGTSQSNPRPGRGCRAERTRGPRIRRRMRGRGTAGRPARLAAAEEELAPHHCEGPARRTCAVQRTDCAFACRTARPHPCSGSHRARRRTSLRHCCLGHSMQGDSVGLTDDDTDAERTAAASFGDATGPLDTSAAREGV